MRVGHVIELLDFTAVLLACFPVYSKSKGKKLPTSLHSTFLLILEKKRILCSQ